MFGLGRVLHRGPCGCILHAASFNEVSSSTQSTLGKLAMGIFVGDANGNRLTIGRAALRYFGKILSALILGIGFLMAAFTENKQALHDKLANCYVMNK